MARAGLRPVDRLTAATERVAATGDLHPIPVDGSDELARLTHSFNEMLQALAASQEQQRRLVADAGHELRTPLTSMRTNLELLASANRPGAPTLPESERAEILDDVQAQVTELSTLVGDLVELARDDAPQVVHETLEFNDVVLRALERARRRAGDVEFVPMLMPWTLVGDSTALERAVLNLLDNAAKWSPPGGVVRVQMRPVDDWSIAARGGRRRPGHRRRGPAAGVRPLLPGRHLAHHARLRARAGHRAAGGGAARRRRLGGAGPGGRCAAGAAAARSPIDRLAWVAVRGLRPDCAGRRGTVEEAGHGRVRPEPRLGPGRARRRDRAHSSDNRSSNTVVAWRTTLRTLM